ncbi:protein containing Peptidase S1 and S6, chymotrypsin/Hap domain [methanotrophic bacterial endosymbiont of Bathymodiolus sp.]|nr:protein containing Peptidase S1 and S6, chymotrypsin/Hap domain [methanotrophic bacterial endosymbiont of Bathymodiolus sp.]
MLKLKSSSSIKPIQLASPYTSPSLTEAKALGWGNIIPSAVSDSDLFNKKKVSVKKLREVDLPIVSHSTCLLSIIGSHILIDSMVCAGNGLGNKDACQGDSGGPLIAFSPFSKTWIHAGVTSFGNGCALPDTYGVYAKTQKITAWLSDLMCSKEEVPDPSSSVTFDIHNDNSVTFTWDSVDGATGYHLNYWYWMHDEQKISPKKSIDLNSNTFTTSGPVDPGSYSISITSYKNNCLGEETKAKPLRIYR